VRVRVVATTLPNVLLLDPVRHHDARGWVCEPFGRAALAEAGVDLAVVQTTLIRSTKRGTLRGLYPQVAPHPQTKLVQVLRRGSPGFGRHVAVTLDAAGAGCSSSRPASPTAS
jgi:dTDP-4-dehydrorhamnose 3,5-epimerase